LRNPKGLTVIPEERDAWAFLDAAAITSSRQQRAVIELVRGLKNAQLWTKMKAIYPFVGGTATTHKYNLKDPRDVNAAYRLTFTGGWTHSSNGADPNGTNAYADTYVSPSTQLSDGSAHWSFYSRENIQGTKNDFGAFNSSFSNGFACASRWIDGNLYSDCYATGTNRIATASTSSQGFYTGTRNTTTSFKVFRNGTQLGNTNTNTSSGRSSISANITIASYSNGTGLGNYSDRQYVFFSFGDGLTDTDATALYAIVQRFQTSLGRQV
jgi:hypothetical protein